MAEPPSEDHVDFVVDAQHRFQQWIQFADAKAGAVLVILGLGLADLISRSGSLSEAYKQTSCWGTLASWSFWLACAAATMTVVTVSISLFPRLKHDRESLGYFGDVGNYKSSAAYITALRKAPASDLFEMNASQVWQLGRIASLKLRLLRISYWFVVGFLALLVVARLSLAWGS